MGRIMDLKMIGMLIKDFREKLGLTKMQLANGICTEEFIEKIENGERRPYAELMDQISTRLNIDLNDYINLSQYVAPSFVKKITSEIDNARNLKNYARLAKLLDSIKSHKDFETGFASQFYLWNRGIAEYELNKNHKLAKALLLKAMNITRPFDLHTNLNLTCLTNQEMKVINALIILLYQHNDQQLAKQISKSLVEGDSIFKNYKQQDPIIALTITYSVFLSREDKYAESLVYLNKARNYLTSNDDLYMLSQVFYHISMNHYSLDNKDTAKEYIDMAKMISTIKSEVPFGDFISKQISKYHIH